MPKHKREKEKFAKKLKAFAKTLPQYISSPSDGTWTIRGFIDMSGTVYTVSNDTKVVSKVLELQLFPRFQAFADSIGYELELATHQNWYPDLTFICKDNSDIKFAVDLKTTYRKKKDPSCCNGFTLGSHGKYFCERDSKKNIQYPYQEYSGHFCICVIYSRINLKKREEFRAHSLNDLPSLPPVIEEFQCFAEEKWKLASRKSGSGNTANIGSIKKIEDLVAGKGEFESEKEFDAYWKNFGKKKSE